MSLLFSEPFRPSIAGRSERREVRRTSRPPADGLRGEESIAELCRREGIASSMYYGWLVEGVP